MQRIAAVSYLLFFSRTRLHVYFIKEETRFKTHNSLEKKIGIRDQQGTRRREAGGRPSSEQETQ